MIYKDFKNKKLSMLGMGCMRLPLKDDESKQIDEEKTAEMIEYALSNGVNYFDTAWGYHEGNSETVMGKLLEKYPRDSFYLASKFPGYDLTNFKKAKEIFEKQLEKCRVDYFDFYLIHNVCESNINHYLDNEKYGDVEYVISQKEAGRIRHLGFSAHGNLSVMRSFLEKYSEYMEFCQIQLNWVDYEFQNAKSKIELLKEFNLPIWVMEPLRGGKLASLEDEYKSEMKTIFPDGNEIEGAFRYLQSFPDIKIILSGMSDFNQLKENIEIFKTEKPLNEKQIEGIYKLAEKMTNKKTLPCTACRYCTSYCPKELDIPAIIELYNEHSFTDGGFIAPMTLSSFSDDKKPSACIGCKSCEAVCPQQIKISEMMTQFKNI